MTVVVLTKGDLETLGLVGGRLLFRSRESNIPKEADWNGLTLSEFKQETQGIEVEGEFYPPTFNWYANMTGQRRRDGVNFYLKVVVSRDASFSGMVFTLLSAFTQFNEYTDCICTVASACSRHFGLSTKEPKE
jgi:hypothetical protein